MIYDSFKIFMGLPTTGKGFSDGLFPSSWSDEKLIATIGGAAPPPNKEKA